MATANPNSDRSAVKDLDSVDLDNFTTQVDDTYHALRAFNYLTDHMGELGGQASGVISYGIGHLLRRQLDDLEEIRDKVFEMASRLRNAEKSAVSVDVSGQPEGWITPPIYDEATLRAKIEAEEAAAVARLRRADLKAVARDTKLEEDTVRRVVDRLLAGQSEVMGKVAQ